MTHTDAENDGFSLSARWVFPAIGPVLSPGYVAVRRGRIVAVGEGPPPSEFGPVTAFGDAAICPGFINAHTHLGCGFLKGMPTGADFVEWMTAGVAPRVIAAAKDMPERIDEGADLSVREACEAGMTTLLDSFFLDAGKRAMHRRGVKGVFAREYFGASASDIERYTADVAIAARDEAVRERDTKIRFALAPHAPYTAPHAVLEALAQVARDHRLLTTIHLAESAAESRMFQESAGPMFDIFAAGEKRARYRLGMSPTAACDLAGILGPQTLAVHAVHLSNADIALLAVRGAHVVHCPMSNARLGTGVAPVRALVDRGVNVCLGTDSAASNGALDLFAEMRAMLLAQRSSNGAPAFAPKDAFAMVTMNAARALGLADECGSLEVGKAADITVVRLDRARHRPVSDPLSTLVWSAETSDVLAVFVDGVSRHRAQR